VRNRPVAALRDAGLTVFADDGAGTRVKKTDPDATATYYVSDSFEVIGGVHTTYEFLGNVRFAQARGAEVTYFVQDHLHSTSASLAQDGSLSESGAYLPFGADRTPASVTATAYGFTDQERDRSTGFYNYDARQYDPEASRFISPDSLLPDPYDPQQLNRYAYARNNPLKYVDPSGHCLDEDCRDITAEDPELNAAVTETAVRAIVEPIDIAFDLKAAYDSFIKGDIWGGFKNLGLAAVPGFLGALAKGGAKITSTVAKHADEAAASAAIASKRVTDDQTALKEIVDEATLGGRKPLSKTDAETILDWAEEVNYPGARAKQGDVSYPSNWAGRPGHPNEPHIHVPGVGTGHIPAEPGIVPR
jgi:RHS repeat-associated protein